MWVTDESSGYAPAVVSAVTPSGIEVRVLPVDSDGIAPADLAALPSVTVPRKAAAAAPAQSAPTPSSSSSAAGGASKFAASKFGASTSSVGAKTGAVGTAGGAAAKAGAGAASTAAPAVPAEPSVRVYRRSATSAWSSEGLADLHDAGHLSEALLLDTLRRRLASRKPTTVCGPVILSADATGLIAGPQAASAALKQLKESADRGLVEGNVTEDVNLVKLFRSSPPARPGRATVAALGDSGSGKTRSVVAAASSLLETHGSTPAPLARGLRALSAFTQAATQATPSASLALTSIRVGIDRRTNLVSGVEIQLAAFDSARASSTVPPGERASDVFYQLLAGLDSESKAKAGLEDAKAYALLSRSGRVAVDGVDDAAAWIETSAALAAVGVPAADVDRHVRSLAGVLCLSNLTFGEAAAAPTSAAELTDAATAPLEAAGKALGVKAEDLWEALTTTAAGPASVAAAQQQCSAATSAIFAGLVQSVVDKVNFALGTAYGAFNAENHAVTFLDVPGWGGVSFGSLAHRTAVDACLAVMASQASQFAAMDEAGNAARNVLPSSSCDVVEGMLGSPALLAALEGSGAAEDVAAAVSRASSSKVIVAAGAAGEFSVAHTRGRTAYSHASYATPPALSAGLMAVVASASTASVVAPAHPVRAALALVADALLAGSPGITWLHCIRPTAPASASAPAPGTEGASSPASPSLPSPSAILQQLRGSGALGAMRVYQRGYTARMTHIALLRRYAHLLTPSTRKRVAQMATLASQQAAAEAVDSTAPAATALLLAAAARLASSSSSSSSSSASSASVVGIADSLVPEVRLIMAHRAGDADEEDASGTYILVHDSVLLRSGVLRALDRASWDRFAAAAATLVAKTKSFLIAARYRRFMRAIRAIQGRKKTTNTRKEFIVLRDERRRRMALATLAVDLRGHAFALDAVLDVARGTHEGVAMSDESVLRALDIARLTYEPAAAAVAGPSPDEARTSIAAYASTIEAVRTAVHAVISRKDTEIRERAAAVGRLTDASEAVTSAIVNSVKSGLVQHADLKGAVDRLPDTDNTRALRDVFASPDVAAPLKKAEPHLLSREALLAVLRAISDLATAISTVASPDWERYARTIAIAKASAVRADRIIPIERARRGSIAANKSTAESSLAEVVTSMNSVREAAGVAGVVTWPTVVSAMDTAVQRIATASSRIQALASSLFSREDITLSIVDAPDSSDGVASNGGASPDDHVVLTRLEAAVSHGVLAQYLEGVDAARQAVVAAEREVAVQNEVNIRETDAYASCSSAIVSSTSQLRAIWSEALAADFSVSASHGSGVAQPPVPALEAQGLTPANAAVREALAGVLAVPVREAIAAATATVLTAHSVLRTAAEQRSRKRPSLGVGASASEQGVAAIDTGMDIAALQDAATAATTAVTQAESVQRGEMRRRFTDATARREALSSLAQATEEAVATLTRAQSSGIAGFSVVSSASDIATARLHEARGLLASADPFSDTGLAVAKAAAARHAVQAFAETVSREETRHAEYQRALVDARRQIASLLERLVRLQATAASGAGDVAGAGPLTDEFGVPAAVDAAQKGLSKAVRLIMGDISHPALDSSPHSDATPSLLQEAHAVLAAAHEAESVVTDSEEVVNRAKAARQSRIAARARGTQSLSVASTRIEAIRTGAALLDMTTEPAVVNGVASAEASIARVLPLLNSTARTAHGTGASPVSFLDMEASAIAGIVDDALTLVTAAELAFDSLKTKRAETDKLRVQAAAADRSRRDEEQARIAAEAQRADEDRLRHLSDLDALQARLTEVVRQREINNLRDCAVLRKAIKTAEATVEAASDKCVSAGPAIAGAAVGAVASVVPRCEELLSALLEGRRGALERLDILRAGWDHVCQAETKRKEMLVLADVAAAAVAAAKLISVDGAGDDDADEEREGARAETAPSPSPAPQSSRRHAPVVPMPSFVTFIPFSAQSPGRDAASAYASSPSGLQSQLGLDEAEDLFAPPATLDKNRALSEDEKRFSRDIVLRMAGEIPVSSGPDGASVDVSTPLSDIVLTAAEVAAAIAKANLSLPPLGSKIDPHERARCVAAALADAKERKRTLLVASRHLPPEPASRFMRQAEEAAAASAFATATSGRATEGPLHPVPPIVTHFLQASEQAIAAARVQVAIHARAVAAFDAAHGLGVAVEVRTFQSRLGAEVTALADPHFDAAPGSVAASDSSSAPTAYDLDSALPSAFPTSLAELQRATSSALSVTESAYKTVAHVKAQAEGRTLMVLGVRRQKIAGAKAFDVLRLYGARLAKLRSDAEQAARTGDLAGAEAAVDAALVAAEETGKYAENQVAALSTGTTQAETVRDAGPEAVVDLIVKAVRTHVDACRKAREVYESERSRIRALRARERSMDPHTPGMGVVAGTLPTPGGAVATVPAPVPSPPPAPPSAYGSPAASSPSAFSQPREQNFIAALAGVMSAGTLPNLMLDDLPHAPARREQTSQAVAPQQAAAVTGRPPTPPASVMGTAPTAPPSGPASVRGDDDAHSAELRRMSTAPESLAEKLSIVQQAMSARAQSVKTPPLPVSAVPRDENGEGAAPAQETPAPPAVVSAPPASASAKAPSASSTGRTPSTTAGTRRPGASSSHPPPPPVFVDEGAPYRRGSGAGQPAVTLSDVSRAIRNLSAAAAVPAEQDAEERVPASPSASTSSSSAAAGASWSMRGLSRLASSTGGPLASPLGIAAARGSAAASPRAGVHHAISTSHLSSSSVLLRSPQASAVSAGTTGEAAQAWSSNLRGGRGEARLAALSPSALAANLRGAARGPSPNKRRG